MATISLLVVLVHLLTPSQGSREKTAEKSMCGYNSLLVALCAVGDVSATELKGEFPDDEAPFSFADLERAARRSGFQSQAVRWNNPDVARLDRPCVLHVHKQVDSPEPDHFVACIGGKGDWVCIVDFPEQPILMHRKDLMSVWNGDVLYLGNHDKPPNVTMPLVNYIERFIWLGVLITSAGLATVIWRGRKRQSKSLD